MYERQRRTYESRCPEALRHRDSLASSGSFDEMSWYRCSGSVLCETCGACYYDHPRHLIENDLTVICIGDVVKL